MATKKKATTKSDSASAAGKAPLAVSAAENKERKLHVEMAPYNWRRIIGYIKAFNSDPHRTRSAMKYGDVVNEALAYFFKRRAEEKKEPKRRAPSSRR